MPCEFLWLHMSSFKYSGTTAARWVGYCCKSERLNTHVTRHILINMQSSCQHKDTERWMEGKHSLSFERKHVHFNQTDNNESFKCGLSLFNHKFHRGWPLLIFEVGYLLMSFFFYPWIFSNILSLQLFAWILWWEVSVATLSCSSCAQCLNRLRHL